MKYATKRLEELNEQYLAGKLPDTPPPVHRWCPVCHSDSGVKRKHGVGTPCTHADEVCPWKYCSHCSGRGIVAPQE